MCALHLSRYLRFYLLENHPNKRGVTPPPCTRLIICVFLWYLASQTAPCFYFFCGSWRGDYKSSKNPATALQGADGHSEVPSGTPSYKSSPSSTRVLKIIPEYQGGSNIVLCKVPPILLGIKNNTCVCWVGKKSNGRVFLCYLGIKNNTCAFYPATALQAEIRCGVLGALRNKEVP